VFSSALHSRYLISIYTFYYLYLTPTSGSLIFATDDGCWSSETKQKMSRTLLDRNTRVGGKREARVWGYGVPASGKRGVWWKTRGVENTGSRGERGV